jgi:predicted nucleotidyltransferase
MILSSDQINTIRNYFHDKPVLKAFVFGSFSRNEASIESDIDLLVELDYSQHIGLGFVKMKLDLEDKLQKKVDIISLNAISKHILPFINNDKKLIYER